MFSSNRCPSSLHLSGASTLHEPALAVHPQYLGLKIEIKGDCDAGDNIRIKTEHTDQNGSVDDARRGWNWWMIEHCSNKSELAEDGQIP
jgi:hypothetical protein